VNQENTMSENLSVISEAIRERFAAQEYAFLGEVSLIVKPEQIVEVCKALRDEFNFEVLTEENRRRLLARAIAALPCGFQDAVTPTQPYPGAAGSTRRQRPVYTNN
jgi:hypothetical protein